MGWIAFGALMLLGVTNVVLTLLRAPVAARLAASPGDVPRVAADLAVTSFHIAVLAMSLFLALVSGVGVLYANPDAETVVAPLVGGLFFTYAYLQARYRSGYLARLAHRQWIGAADGETEEIYAVVFRARAWILGAAVLPPVVVLLLRLFLFGALGTVDEIPTGMRWA
jgi:hypothetical protein